MSIQEDILEAFPEKTIIVSVNRHADHHGEPATSVAVQVDGKTVDGIFTTQKRDAFGGVDFYQQKDIAGLMISKIQSVLDGTAE